MWRPFLLAWEEWEHRKKLLKKQHDVPVGRKGPIILYNGDEFVWGASSHESLHFCLPGRPGRPSRPRVVWLVSQFGGLASFKNRKKAPPFLNIVIFNRDYLFKNNTNVGWGFFFGLASSKNEKKAPPPWGFLRVSSVVVTMTTLSPPIVAPTNITKKD